jgi:peptidyl-prolyl cis-trans isomerase C
MTAFEPEAYAASEDKVLARIGNQTVTDTDLKEIVAAFPDRFYQTPDGQAKALDYLVNINVLAAEAQRQGLDKDPEVQRLVAYTMKDLLARFYLEKASKNLPAPTEAEAKAFYEKNRSQFLIPESVLLRHILVKTEKEAKDALTKIKKGEKLSDLASQISICPSRVKGGSLDWMPRGYLVKEIEEPAFSMKVGEMVGPVQSKFGYHILLLEDKRAPQETSYEQAQDTIMERLRYQAQQDHYEKLATELRQKMNVQVTQPAGDSSTAAPAAPAVPAGPTAQPKK